MKRDARRNSCCSTSKYCGPKMARNNGRIYDKIRPPFIWINRYRYLIVTYSRGCQLHLQTTTSCALQSYVQTW
ncbi:hypothetical protein [Diadegma fenestrale ichnovirus]|nr:hypothetical protein [Diadegma fenestrale ichnovirus]